jgi:phosphatidylserine decarboxylase
MGDRERYREDYVEARYQGLYGRAAGFLPRDRAALDAYRVEVQRAVEAKREAAGAESLVQFYAPSVQALAELIETNGVVRMYVTQMIEEQPTDHQTVTGIPDLLDSLNHIVTTAPAYNPDPNKLNAFPMSSLFTYMMMTPAGEAIFRDPTFNDALRGVLGEWCHFLTSPESRYVLTEEVDGWLSRSAYYYNKLYEFEIPDPSAPHWGFSSYNAYFHRQIKPEARPLAGKGDPTVVVSANDGSVYNIQDNIQPLENFWLKGQPYSLVNMLDNLYVERFIGGTVFQSFLSGADYHRWRAPISGTVVCTKKVPGLMFSDAESAGFDPTAATYSQGYGASVNTRGLVFIESEHKNIGMVCVMPIGITEISSVTFKVKDGEPVKKGQELGYFSYGGSGMCLVFQPGAIDQFTVPNRVQNSNPDDGPPIRVNSQIAIARV